MSSDRGNAQELLVASREVLPREEEDSDRADAEHRGVIQAYAA